MAADCFGLPLFLFAVQFAVRLAVLVCGKMSCTRRNLFQKCHSELVSESMNAEINSA